MDKGLYIAVSGATAQSKALDALAHNIANASTVGYQATRMTFSSVFHGAERETAQVRVDSVQADQTRGRVKKNGNSLDVALANDGYFVVETPAGERLTRAGSFRLSADGRLVTGEGFSVLGLDGAPLEVPGGAHDAAIGEDGVLRSQGQALGQLRVARARGEDLIQQGHLYRPKEGGVIEDLDDSKVVPETVEMANFNVVEGMTDLIRIHRTYETLTRAIQTYQKIGERAAREIGR